MAPRSTSSYQWNTHMKSDKPTVYIIDDDEAVRDSISMLLDTENIEHKV